VEISAVDGNSGCIDFSNRERGNRAPSRAKRTANTGDLIVSTVRPYLKSFVYLDHQPEDCVFSTGFAVITSKSGSVEMNKMLYYLFMYSADLMTQIEAKMPKHSYPSIGDTDIKGFTIPTSVVCPDVFLKHIAEAELCIARNQTKTGRTEALLKRLVSRLLGC
jgi:hypothetical protein